LQNVQRGIIFIWLATLALVGTMLTVKLIKRRIDYRRREGEEVEANSAQEKYKDQEATEHKFEEKAVADTAFAETDTCVDRLVKKTCEFNVTFNPLMMSVILSFVAGHSYAFSFSIYLFALVFCLVFNVFKVHRAWVEQVFARWLIEVLFPLCYLLLMVNLVVGESSDMLYTIRQA
jgi:Fe2+ transport system protein B